MRKYFSIWITDPESWKNGGKNSRGTVQLSTCTILEINVCFLISLCRAYISGPFLLNSMLYCIQLSRWIALSKKLLPDLSVSRHLKYLMAYCCIPIQPSISLFLTNSSCLGFYLSFWTYCRISIAISLVPCLSISLWLPSPIPCLAISLWLPSPIACLAISL